MLLYLYKLETMQLISDPKYLLRLAVPRMTYEYRACKYNENNYDGHMCDDSIMVTCPYTGSLLWLAAWLAWRCYPTIVCSGLVTFALATAGPNDCSALSIRNHLHWLSKSEPLSLSHDDVGTVIIDSSMSFICSRVYIDEIKNDAKRFSNCMSIQDIIAIDELTIKVKNWYCRKMQLNARLALVNYRLIFSSINVAKLHLCIC